MLGDLEARVMEAVWALGGPAPARAIHARVAKQHDVEPLTVITVLNKLVAKGLLERNRHDDLLHYGPRRSREQFMSDVSRHVVEGVLAFNRTAVAASFVDVLAERDPKQLAELGRLIRRKLRDTE